MTTLEEGQRWEFVNATMETVTEYTLETVDGPAVKGPLATLLNPATGGRAYVYVRTLQEAEVPGYSYWRVAS